MMLTLIYALNYLDRQLVSLLAEPIKHDLHLSDTQLGLVGGIVFVAFYATFGIPVGWLADRFNRVRIVSIACALWSLFTVLCGMTASLAQLVVARMGVGVGEAGGTPPSYSLISDLFGPSERATALAIYSMAVPAGAMLGVAGGGFIAAAFGWRAAFFCLGLPGLLLALLLFAFVEEPRRGGLDHRPHGQRDSQPHPPLGEAIAEFVRNPILVCIAVAGALAAFVGYAATAWFPPYLMRVKGMSLRELATYYSLVVGVAGMVGILTAGRLADRLMPRDPRWAAWLPAIAFLVSLPCWIGALWAPSWQVALVFIAVPSLVNPLFLAPTVAVVHNSVVPNRRAVSGAILLFTVNLFGLGAGPFYVGRISDLAEGRYGTESLGVGLASLIPFIGLTSGAYLLAARAIGRSSGPSAKSA